MVCKQDLQHPKLLEGYLHKVDDVHLQGIALALDQVLAPSVEVQLRGGDLHPGQSTSVAGELRHQFVTCVVGSVGV